MIGKSADSGDAGLEKRVLICEDDKDMAKLLQFMLAYEGLIADIACTAAQAKQMLADQEYLAMTLDLGLPDQSGMSLIRELRASPETADLPIIIISANADKGQAELQGQAFSVVDFINKRMEHEQFAATLKQAVARIQGDRPKVLHIEDDLDIYKMVNVIVGDIVEIDNAPTLAAARQMLKNKRYDLVILDIVLPDGSGMELMPDFNRASPPIPVMVFSSQKITQEDIRQVEIALVKSRTDNVQLLTTIKHIINGK